MQVKKQKLSTTQINLIIDSLVFIAFLVTMAPHVIISLIVLPFAVVPWLRNRGKKGSSGGQPPLDQETYA